MGDLFTHAHVDAPRSLSLHNNGHYPDAPGYRNTDTSKAAAASIAPSKELLQGQVLDCMARHKAMTADECAAFLRLDKLSIRPRFTELKQNGLIIDTGIRRLNGSGRKAIVWRRAAGN